MPLVSEKVNLLFVSNTNVRYAKHRALFDGWIAERLVQKMTRTVFDGVGLVGVQLQLEHKVVRVRNDFTLRVPQRVYGNLGVDTLCEQQTQHNTPYPY